MLLVKIMLYKFKCLTTLLLLAICHLRNKVGYRNVVLVGGHGLLKLTLDVKLVSQ